MNALGRRLGWLRDRLRASLFWVPMVFIVGGVALGQLMLVVDAAVEEVPRVFVATVESARVVLSVVAGATVGFSGVAFSVSLLLFSMSASQYSPRVVHGLFRDPYNKRIMGVVLGTFTYCLMVLRAVQAPLDDGGSATVPSISIVVAVALGVVTLLAIVAFIDHGAHSMDVSTILHRTCSESLVEIRRQWPARDGQSEGGDSEPVAGSTPPDDGDRLELLHREHGWIQEVDTRRLLRAMPAGSVLTVHTRAGRYAVSGSRFATLAPRPAELEALEDELREGILVGESRTMHDDATYGVRQLVDVALKALSPGVNDPTTAQDAMFHVATLLRELLLREPPAAHVPGPDGRRIELAAQPTHAGVVALAFDEVRLAAASLPTVLAYLLEIAHQVATTVAANGYESRAELVVGQARLIRDGIAANETLLAADRGRVLAAFDERFGAAG